MKKYLTKKIFIRFFLTIVDIIFGFIFSFFPKNKLPNNPKKILIVKPDHLGDMLLTTSIFRLLKERFFDARIDIVSGEWACEILKNNPYISKIYFINVFSLNREGISRIKKIYNFLKTYFLSLKQIRKENYDLGLFLRARRGRLISLALIGKIKYTIGHGVAGFGFLLSKEVEWENGKHEVEHYLEILAPLGIKKDLKYLLPELYPSEKDKERSHDIYKSLNGKKKVAIVHPGSGDISKTLSNEKWEKILDLLDKKEYTIVLTGNEKEKYLLKSIAHNKQNIKIFAGSFNILELFEFFKLANVIITVDSLSAHLAGISRVKTIVFYSARIDISQWKALGENIKHYKIECEKSPCESGCNYMKCMDFDIEKIRDII